MKVLIRFAVLFFVSLIIFLGHVFLVTKPIELNTCEKVLEQPVQNPTEEYSRCFKLVNHTFWCFDVPYAIACQVSAGIATFAFFVLFGWGPKEMLDELEMGVSPPITPKKEDSKKRSFLAKEE